MVATDRNRERDRHEVVDVVLFAGAAAVVALDLGTLLLTGQWRRSPLGVLTFIAAQVAGLVAAVRSLRTPGQQPNGRLLLALTGGDSALDLLSVWQDAGPAAFLAGIGTWFVTTGFGQLLLRWPAVRVATRSGRALVAFGYVALPALTLTWQLLWDRRWFGRGSASWWWPTLVPDRNGAYDLYVATQILFAAVLVAFVLLVAIRVARTPTGARRTLAPVAVSAALLAATTAVVTAERLGWNAGIDANVLQNLALLALPVGVLISLGRAGTGDGPAVAVAPRAARVHAAARAGWAALAVALAVLAVVLGARSIAAGVTSTRVPDPHPLPAPQSATRS